MCDSRIKFMSNVVDFINFVHIFFMFVMLFQALLVNLFAPPPYLWILLVQKILIMPRIYLRGSYSSLQIK